MNIKDRLEYLRGELRAERISWGEIAELESLAPHIEPDDTELRQAAGLPEYPMNLDDEEEVSGFIKRYGNNKDRRLANALGLTGKGSHAIANKLSGYAWNKHTAIELRKEGKIAEAMKYEAICERIYSELPKHVKW